MRHRMSWIGLTIVAALVMAPAAAYALPLDDVIPGVALPASPVAESLDVAMDSRDIFSVSLDAGDTLALDLSVTTGASADCDLDLYLYGPDATSADHGAAAAKAVLPLHYPETIRYTAPASGVYFVEVFAAEGSGPYSLQWSAAPEPLLPVYRFFNWRTGTHFYTPSLDEANSVILNYSNTFAYEGPAYYTRASRNTQPLYRFYNRVNGSHFYTASASERDAVIAQWSGVFTYEGETYRVSTAAEAGKIPVYRFYNRRNGSHFYTASLDEANTVIANYGATYAFEGPAFWLGQ